MRFFVFLFRFLLLLTTPAIAVPSNPPMEEICLFSFDEILDLIESIESGQREESPDQTECIAQFICILAEKGTSLRDPVQYALLQQDMDVLLCKNNALLCKSWLSTKSQHVKHFVKAHKKAILIGAAILAAAAIVTTAVVAIGAAAAVTSTGSAVAFAQNEPQNRAPTQFPQKPAPVQQANRPPQLEQVFEEKTENMKTTLLQEIVEDQILRSEQDPGWLTEKARQFGAVLAHEVLEAAATLGSAGPQLITEVQELSSRWLPKDSEIPTSELFHQDPLENYTKKVSAFHEQIDEIFSTDLARKYTLEKESDFAVGLLPPPGLLNGIFANNSELLAAGRTLDRGGLTRAGRALMKHGYREGTVFPRPVGTPHEINSYGEQVLEKILNDPNREILIASEGGIKIYSPDGRGAYFKPDGTFRGFIERQYEK